MKILLAFLVLGRQFFRVLNYIKICFSLLILRNPKGFLLAAMHIFQVRGVCICDVHFCGYWSGVYGAVEE